jgi:hypothetical protein
MTARRVLAARDMPTELFLGRQFQWHPYPFNHRDVTFTAISRAPLDKISAYKTRISAATHDLSGIFLLRVRSTRGRPWTCGARLLLGQRSQSGNGP